MRRKLKKDPEEASAPPPAASAPAPAPSGSATAADASHGVKGSMKDRILDDMIGSVPGSFKILVVDKTATDILSVCLRMNELMDHGVTLVEDIKQVRQPIPKSPVIYFLAPTDASVKLIIQDWATKDPYLEAYIFFTGTAPQKLIDDIAAARVVQKVKGLKDMLLDFWVPETLNFHFQLVDELPDFVGTGANPGSRSFQNALSKLRSVAHTFGDLPLVRYQQNAICKAFATQFGEIINELAKEVPALSQKKDNRTVLLIVDRTIDIYAPLLHDRTYGGLLDDVMPLRDMLYQQTYEGRSGKTETRKFPVDEMDPVWCTYRHMFLPQVLQKLPAQLKQLHDDNPALSGGMQKGAKLAQVGNAIRALPEFQEKNTKLSMHIDILTKLMDIYKRQGLAEASDFEQQLATNSISFKEAFDTMKKMSRGTLNDEAKMRLLLLLVATFGQKDFNESKRKQLVADCGLEMDGEKLSGIDKMRPATTPLPGADKKTAAATQGERDPYICQVKLIADALVADKLSTTDFPFLKSSDAALAAPGAGKKSLRSGGSKYSGKTGERPLELGNGELVPLASPQRLVILVLGGVTRVEVRAAYESSRENKREVIVGGTSLMRPDDFLRQLIALS